MGETLKKTTLGDKNVGDVVNLEASLRLGDEVGGHFVFGHVDATGEIKEIKKLINSYLVSVRVIQKLMKYVVPQGSVTIDGVSLTVARVGKSDFTVALVDYTLRRTTLKDVQKGDRVNVECDMLAKYIERNRR
jgi:riboflavin synthase